MEEHTLVASDSVLMVRGIGSFTYTGRRCEIYSTHSIGRYCSFGQEILIGAGPHPTDWLSTSTFFYRKGMFGGADLTEEFYDAQELEFLAIKKPVTIGNDVWIGSRAIIMAGVDVGHGAVIAAGAIVTKDIDPYTIVAGVPARPVRRRFDTAIVDRLLASEWWEINPTLIKGLNYSNIDEVLDIVEIIKKSRHDWKYLPRSVTVSAC